MTGASQVVLLAVGQSEALAVQNYVVNKYGYVPNMIPVGSQPSVDNRVDLTNQRVTATNVRVDKLERQVEVLLDSYGRTPELIDAIRNA